MPRLVDAFEHFFDSQNPSKPLANGLLDFFESGSSTTRKDTFADSGETIPNSNPVVLNGDGKAPNVFGSGTYRVILRDSLGTQIVQRDPVGGDENLAFGADWIDDQVYSENDVVRDEGTYWISLTSDNQGNKPSTDGGTNWRPWPDGQDLQDLSITTEKINNLAVVTAKIADDAVTTAKLGAGTADRLLGYDGSGDPSEVSIGAGLDLSSSSLSNTTLPIDRFHYPTLTTGSDADHDVDIGDGKISDSTAVDVMSITALTKQIDAAWAAGTNQGGLFSGTVAANTTYHLFVIKNPTSGVVDAGWDTSLTAANAPAGFTLYRRIHSYVTDASSNIINTIRFGDLVQYVTPILDVDVASIGSTTVQTATISVPTGIRLLAFYNNIIDASATTTTMYNKPTDVTDQPPSTTVAPLGVDRTEGSSEASANQVFTLTDTNAQINYRATSSAALFKLATVGYIDYRIT